MDEATIPGTAEETEGEVSTSSPEATTEQPAEDKTSEDQTEPEGSATPADPELDKKIEWAKAKGIPTDDLNAAALKAIDVAYNREREFHESRQKKSLQEELKPTQAESTDVDPDMASWRKELAESRFYKAHPDAEGHETELAAVAKDYPYLRDLYAAGYSAELSSQALKAMWEIHQGRNVEAQVKAAEARGREQAKQEIAAASVAGTRKGNATTPPVDKTQDEERLERFSNW